LDFIFPTHTHPLTECPVGRNVVVIGAGNTAIDVATQAVRLGAKSVLIAYRRTEKEMSAFVYEYELAKADGVGFEWCVQPLEFLSRNGTVEGIKFRRLESTDHGLAATLNPIANSEFVIHCDMAVKALGQTALLDLLAGIQGLRFDKGKLQVDPKTGATGVPGLFAGGDCISMGAEIVNAVQEGKVAARGIDQYLKTRGP
jgi:glutamate synthase (NADPH/NADH) small chain